MTLYQEHSDFIAKVTRTLNQLGDPPDSMYLRVELRYVDGDDLFGAWSDEIASDAWAFDEHR